MRLKASCPSGGFALPFYFRKPAIIFSSACSSVRPSVRSFISCSPAILPMAASWMSEASRWAASSAGVATTVALSARIASHSE